MFSMRLKKHMLFALCPRLFVKFRIEVVMPSKIASKYTFPCIAFQICDITDIFLSLTDWLRASFSFQFTLQSIEWLGLTEIGTKFTSIVHDFRLSVIFSEVGGI